MVAGGHNRTPTLEMSKLQSQRCAVALGHNISPPNGLNALALTTRVIRERNCEKQYSSPAPLARPVLDVDASTFQPLL
jgi:hypothetical protein